MVKLITIKPKYEAFRMQKNKQKSENQKRKKEREKATPTFSHFHHTKNLQNLKDQLNHTHYHNPFSFKASFPKSLSTVLRRLYPSMS